MAQDIALQGAVYSSVPAVELPISGGGTASFYDVTDTTASAADVSSGKYFYTAAGSFESGTATGGGGDLTIDDVAMRTFSQAIGSSTTIISAYAFYSCAALTTASFPAATTIGSHAFYYCTALTTMSFPVATTISAYAFYSCTALTTVSFPAASTIGSYAFYSCRALTTASFPALTKILSSYAFRACYRLISLYLMGSSVVTLSQSNAFSSTPIGGYSTTAGQYGSVYVPASLYSSYIAAAQWSLISSRIVSV